MTDNLHKLLSDTFAYVKDPLHPKEILFCSEMDEAWFAPIAVPKPVEKKLEISFTEKPPVIKIPQPDPNTFSQLKSTLQKVAPSIRLVEEIPDDKEGKQKGNVWKEKVEDAEIILLACHQDQETLELLKSLAKAIHSHLGKAKILPAERLEKEDHWEAFLRKNAFRLIVASQGLEKLHNLQRFYRENQGLFFLSTTPLLLLSSASVYKQLPSKASLWKTLCQMLKK